MKTVSVAKRIPVSADRAWSIIRTGDNMDRWAPMITSCVLTGQGPGATRVCTIDGQQLDEVIETVDDPTRLFQYAIVRQSIMPVSNVRGTIHVTEISANECAILWFANFEIADEAALSQVTAGIEGIYGASIDGLAAMASGG